MVSPGTNLRCTGALMKSPSAVTVILRSFVAGHGHSTHRSPRESVERGVDGLLAVVHALGGGVIGSSQVIAVGHSRRIRLDQRTGVRGVRRRILALLPTVP